MTAGRASAFVERAKRHARPLGLSLSLLAALFVFATVTEEHYPVRLWLFWPYLGYWLLTLGWTFACGSVGDAVVRLLCPRLPATERLVGALAAGLLVFVLGMFVAGVLGLYGPVLFVAWPLGLIAAFGRPFFRFLRRYIRHRLAARRRSPPSVLASVIFLFGLAGVAMVYFPILTPDNIAADSHWYHIAIAEHYVAEGAIRPFVEGWWEGTLPQLATLVYTWAFLLPGGGLFDHVELAAHLEFTIFLWVLFSIPVLARWATAQARSRTNGRIDVSGAWVALFLFPGVFLYDSSVTANADHIAGFWAVPIVLALSRALRAPCVRSGAWLAVPLSGALLTKYQTVMLVSFPIAALLAGSAWTALRPRVPSLRRSALSCVVSCAVAGLVLTSAHWLKNWIFYGDPIYPYLHAYLHVHPWTIDSAQRFERFYKVTQVWRPKGTTSEMLVETAKALFTFSFVPNDWPSFHGKVPVFGSLFTLSILPLVFLRNTRRLWAIVAATHLGLFVWYWISHEDRYLQELVPWMATTVAGMICLAWQSGFVSRVALSLLVGFQIIWGGDVFFIPTHAIIGTVPAKRAIELLSSGYRKDFDARTKVFGFWQIANAMPPKAKIMIHDMQDHLGIGRATVSDVAMWQGGLSYGRIESPRDFYDKMREYGVTDFLWRESLTGYDSLAGDLVFFGFVGRFAGPSRKMEGYFVAPMPSAPPPDLHWLDWPATVAVCSNEYEAGLYALRDLTVPTTTPRTFPHPQRRLQAGGDATALAEQSQFVVFDPTCGFKVAMSQERAFQKMAHRSKVELWIRVDAPPAH